MKLNLGCGYNKYPGYVNVDSDPKCSPDIVANLEEPLPFGDSTVSEIILYHVLEHLGQDTQTYFRIWQEFYRVLKPGGEIRITVPHWNHENFHHDPTHVRKVTPVGVQMFSQKKNRETIDSGGQETTLGIQLGIDFEIENAFFDPTPWFAEAVKTGRATEQDLHRFNNACFQVHIYARAVK